MAVCFRLVLMRKMMRKQMPFMIPLIGEWTIGEKREGTRTCSCNNKTIYMYDQTLNPELCFLKITLIKKQNHINQSTACTCKHPI